jgi:Fe-S-cluster containining protein
MSQNKRIFSQIPAGLTAVAIQDLLDRYGMLLAEVDQWFASCQQMYPNLIACGNGCSSCCRGLFDITLLDAIYLKSGLNLLAPEEQSVIREKSLTRLNLINSVHPGFSAPWLLNPLPEEEWDEIMPEDDDTPCVLLSSHGQCLAYSYRPMTCRLNGIPLFDTSGEELFDDWCTMNFSQADPAELEELRHPFNELFTQELLLFRELTLRLYGTRISEIDTIIPAAILLDKPEQFNRNRELQS